MNAATLEVHIEQGVGWTVNHGPHRFHINTPSGHPSTLLSSATTHTLVATLAMWEKVPGAIRVIPISDGSTVKYLGVVSY